MSEKRGSALRERIEYLQNYVFGRGELTFLDGPVAASVAVPDCWRRLPELVPEGRVGLAVGKVREVLGGRLPITSQLFSVFTRDVELVRIGNDYFLLYLLIGPHGDAAYYLGGNPLQPEQIDPPLRPELGELGSRWGELPEELQSFYRQVHSGLSALEMRCYGLNPSWGVRCLGDFDLGADNPLRPQFADAYVFFSTWRFGGNMLAIDLAGDAPDNGILWMRDDENRLGVNFWGYLDMLWALAIGDMLSVEI
ncbi:SMI1/KNR4 family protein [Buchananella hordeovulneris]|uniref:SMI1/KNR4 family protein n=1 Tax=Buchananella hordeovulneris TaxID=52770 RepID=A0A1Q5PWH1_9ACTO|nr:SMI1/KNR4 family protein [Buchananella hordeovulneris]MDO5081068.1 SMI1/KNR4 family protein [Buchananella hordeovulneris]OKL51740.1 hypothetical protein BSZ40_06215 [Buchananella hordeovulneris]RRD45139.1 hypothetical protein EII13_03065 [Buchananella hordeovulneris]RRD53049.1 hypothetical protein EII12_02870 [Buchananella hordeovulneris]